MTSNANTSQQTQEPGLVAGHAEYVKGVAESTIGSVTGSQAWKASGEQEKAHAMHSMKAAGEKRDPATKGYGKFEEMAGKATGCLGMQSEGAASTRRTE